MNEEGAVSPLKGKLDAGPAIAAAVLCGLGGLIAGGDWRWLALPALLFCGSTLLWPARGASRVATPTGGEAAPQSNDVLLELVGAREAEQREKLLSRELDHRAKNLLAVVQSVVSLTRAGSVAEFKSAVEGRIQSLGRAHSMLAASRWDGADLERVLREELAPYGGGDQAQVTLSGPPLLLKPAAAQSLALIFHELATNAVKYGALSAASGELEVSWEIRHGEARDPLVCLRWEERGGPPVAPRTGSSRSGFGSRLIRSSIERQLGGSLDLDWAEGGLIVKMELALDRSLQAPGEGESLLPPKSIGPNE